MFRGLLITAVIAFYTPVVAQVGTIMALVNDQVVCRKPTSLQVRYRKSAVCPLSVGMLTRVRSLVSDVVLSSRMSAISANRTS